MEFNLDIDAEQVNKMVADAILQSTIGEHLRREIEEQVKRLTHPFNNPLKPVIEQQVAAILRDIIREEYQEKIEAEARRQITDKLVHDTVFAAVEAYSNVVARGGM